MTGPGNATNTSVKEPALGVAYPIRIGKSVQTRRGRSHRPPREMMALKFPHIPIDTDMSRQGNIVQSSTNDTQMSVQLPTKSNPNLEVQHFSGSKRPSKSDYVLVFVNETFWLERVSDIASFKYDRLKQSDQFNKPDVNMMQTNQQRQSDPDSWDAGDESSSPVTPEDEEEDADDIHNNHNNNNNNNNNHNNNHNTDQFNNNYNTNSNHINRVNINKNSTNKGSGGMLKLYEGPANNRPNGRHPSYSIPTRTGFGPKTPSPSMPQSKQIQNQRKETKNTPAPRPTEAGKGLKTISMPAASSTPVAMGNESPKPNESIEEEVLEEFVTDDDESDDDNDAKPNTNTNNDSNNNRGNASSSDEDSSDESSSGSDSDESNEDYTDDSTDDDS